jgi:hypothetical protein
LDIYENRAKLCDPYVYLLKDGNEIICQNKEEIQKLKIEDEIRSSSWDLF